MRNHNRPVLMLESLESRNLMSVDAGSLITAVPPLTSDSFLLSQFGGVASVQLNNNEGPAVALSLQSSSSFDLTGSLPNAFLGQQFVMQKTATPALLPSSIVEAAPIE